MALFLNPCFFAPDEADLGPLLRPGDTFVDIGANIGALTLFAASKVGHSGEVVAIEAHPRTAKYLAENIAMNPWRNIKPLNFAIGDSEGTVHFSSRRADDMNSISDTGIKIPMRKLDDLGPFGHVRLLKIDVEGFEYQVLCGARKTLENTDFVYFEYRYEHSDNCVELLRQAGFSCNPPHRGKLECQNVLATRLPLV